jgi:hypothetical protein
MNVPFGSTATMGSANQHFSHESTLTFLLRKRPQETIESRLQKLHNAICNSNLLPPEMVPEYTAFFELTPRELGFFLLNIIEPAIVCYENDSDAENTLLLIHDSLKELIEKLLPSEKSIDLFLRKCERLTDKAIKRELTQAHLQEGAQRMVKNANEINQLNLSCNLVLNDRIRQINDHRAAAVTRLNDRLNPLQDKMKAIYTTAMSASPEIKTFCQRMEDGEAAIQQLLQQCEIIVTGVRV